MGLLGARVPQLLWVQSQEDAGGVWKGTMAAGPSVSRYLRTALQTWKKGPLVRPLSTCQAPVAGNPSIRRLEVSTPCHPLGLALGEHQLCLRSC